MRKLIIDTDVGTDVDDLFALVYAFRNPNADVQAITTVHGNPEVRGKIVRKLENILEVNVPIIPGVPCSPEAIEKYYGKFEHTVLTGTEMQKPLEARMIPVYDADTNLVAIGPLTNVAEQLETNPTIGNVRDIYVMGSSDDSHNFVVDLEAKEKVYEEPWNIYQITKKDSEKIKVSRSELKDLRGNPLGDLLYQSAFNGMEHMNRPECWMYDVLTVSAALGEDYVKFEQTDSNRFVSYDVDMELKDKLMESVRK